jgi:hypothetical protein
MSSYDYFFGNCQPTIIVRLMHKASVISESDCPSYFFLKTCLYISSFNSFLILFFVYAWSCGDTL